MSGKQLAVECGDYTEDLALAAFLEANEEIEDHDRKRIESLVVGEVHVMGGGAAPICYVTRIA